MTLLLRECITSYAQRQFKLPKKRRQTVRGTREIRNEMKRIDRKDKAPNKDIILRGRRKPQTYTLMLALTFPGKSSGSNSFVMIEISFLKMSLILKPWNSIIISSCLIKYDRREVATFTWKGGNARICTSTLQRLNLGNSSPRTALPADTA